MPCSRGGYCNFRGPEAPVALKAIAPIALALQSFCFQILSWGYTPNLVFAFPSDYDAMCRCNMVPSSYWSSINLVAILFLGLSLHICSRLSITSRNTSEHQIYMEDTRHTKYNISETPLLSESCLGTGLLQSCCVNETPAPPPQAVSTITPLKVVRAAERNAMSYWSSLF